MTVESRFGVDNRDQSLHDKDLLLMQRTNRIPQTEFAELEALRAEHLRLIAQRNQLQDVYNALVEKYKAEDEAYRDALENMYAGGDEPDVELTDVDERKAELDEAEAHAKAAARVLFKFNHTVRATLRGGDDLPEGWNPFTSAVSYVAPPGGLAARLIDDLNDREPALREQIAEAKRVIEKCELQLRLGLPLRHWLAKNGNGSTGQILLGDEANLAPVPTHTPFTKPKNVEIEGWWGEPDPSGSSYEEAEVIERADLEPEDTYTYEEDTANA